MGTAFANTTVLINILVLCFAVVLPKVAARFPPEDEVSGAEIELKSITSDRPPANSPAREEAVNPMV